MQSSLPKISIITPSYNQGDFIEQTILSVLDQGYPNLEYIVIDGGSTDATLKILNKYENRLSFISEQDNGQGHAINKGLQRATGDVVAFLNSDDYYEPGALFHVGNYFMANPEVAWLSGKCRSVNANGEEIRTWITAYKNFWLRTQSYTILLILNYISQPATFWRRNIIEKIGYLDENLDYTMDYEYWLRTGKQYPLHYLPENLVNFRIHSISKSGNTYSKQFDEELLYVEEFSSGLVLKMHVIHNWIIKLFYRVFSKQIGIQSSANK